MLKKRYIKNANTIEMFYCSCKNCLCECFCWNEYAYDESYSRGYESGRDSGNGNGFTK